MSAENNGSTSAGGKRSAKRARVLLAARLETPLGEVEGRLRDLSRKGALVECATLPPVGSEVFFSRGKIKVPARVAWTGNGRVGLEFHCMIDEHEVLVQLGGSAKDGPAKPYRKSWIDEGLAGKERQLAKAWGVTVGLTVEKDDG